MYRHPALGGIKGGCDRVSGAEAQIKSDSEDLAVCFDPGPRHLTSEEEGVVQNVRLYNPASPVVLVNMELLG